MYIYKISNNKNNKVYIGKTEKTVEQRFHRHIQDAISNRLDTHLARAIRSIGPENFKIEIIDTANSVQELNEKEIYWISFYDSMSTGYNSSPGGEGGNTYINKTPEEMAVIKEKLRNSKTGSKNPNARKVKCKSVISGEEFHFGSFTEAQKFFNHSNSNFILKRCNHSTSCLWQKEWMIAYEEDDYNSNTTVTKGNYKSKHICLTDLETNKQYDFPSYAAAERYFNLPLKSISGKAYLKGKEFTHLNRYLIKVLD